LSKWSDVQRDTPAVKGWLSVLELKSNGDLRDYLRISDELNSLVRELDLLEQKLQQRNTSRSVYESSLSKIAQSLSPQWISANAHNIQARIDSTALSALAFSSELLDNEEEEIGLDDFSEIVSLINQLELLLEENEFPDSLKLVIRRHIELAERSMAKYPIQGAGALRDALKMASGDILMDGDALKQSPEVRAAIRALWEEFNRVTNAAIKADALIEAGKHAAKFLADLRS